MKKIVKIFILYFIFIQCVFGTGTQISLVSDTEIENFLKEISLPILKSAGLDYNNVKFYIVNDSSINAFVMGGQNIFVNTGTLTSFDEPDAILGIIAHEVGHISGGHLARANQDLSSTNAITIGSILLGIGALIAGVPEVGQAIIMGSAHVQQQTVLKYTRTQEESADALAITYLNENKMSSEALLKSMQKFYLNELQYSNEMEYFSTHPLSRNRKQFIENKMKSENYDNENFNKKYGVEFNFIKAKILAYNKTNGVGNIVDVNGDYKVYADSILNMNNNKINEALRQVDYLIEKYKTNPYFFELKGDIFLKKNDVKNALVNYKKADEIIKDNTLIKKMIAFIIIKYKQKNMYNEAINNLNYVIQKDKTDISALKLLAEAYYNNGDVALSYLTLAEYYVNIKDFKKANNYIKLASENTKDKNILSKIEDLKLSLK